jgi:S1-C subfamily serine protease
MLFDRTSLTKAQLARAVLFGGTSPSAPFGGFLPPFSGFPGSSAQVQGLGFAIPSDTASVIVHRILLHLPVGYLGVVVQTLDPSTAAYDSLPTGALVEMVQPGSPAAHAGLRPRDIITKVDGQAIDQRHDLQTIVETHQPGQTITLSIVRAGKTLTVPVRLAARPTTAP